MNDTHGWFASRPCASRPQTTRNRHSLPGVSSGYPDDWPWLAAASVRPLWSARRYGWFWPVRDPHRAHRNVRSRGGADRWSLRGYDREGSITPIRSLEQLTFDQLLTCPSSPIFEPLLWRFLDYSCDDELRLLRLETGHCQWDFLRVWPAGVGRTATFAIGCAQPV